ncbi:hypothetical protein LBW99_03665 [Wolbachia endosymbiont of Nasonia oneida]
MAISFFLPIFIAAFVSIIHGSYKIINYQNVSPPSSPSFLMNFVVMCLSFIV